jgi:hypothetical protein
MPPLKASAEWHIPGEAAVLLHAVAGAPDGPAEDDEHRSGTHD